METVNKLRYQLIVWLLSGCFLVFGMVVVGGITRLTGSGLSITEWKVVTGTIPPLNEMQWNAEFEKYKQIPQYKSVNAHFTLSDFKFIYFWEYIHRLFGRMIGLVFMIGLLYFYVRKAIPKGLMPKLILMFVLGGIQGFLGWYMVASGLSQNIRVSHIRLAIHLTFAFITFGYIFWVALTQLYDRKVSNAAELTSFRKHAFTLLLLLTLQVIYGAFVAGTKAGWTYNTWPKMGVEWVPESIGFAWSNDGISSLINNLASIQFIHRGLAYILTFFIIIFSIKLFKTNLNTGQKNAVWFLLLGIFMQVLLGIITLLLQVPLWLGVLHQAIAFFLFAGVIYLMHRLKFE
ncbi:MAG: COX15/CtaA family protein [Bacteroidetes bacterium]|nr:COX15/CtaA family protein [Bacteroidota bacterium]